VAEIRFRHVTKVFNPGRKDAVVAVDDLDLTMPDGELIVLVGPSGCGKTTTLRMLAGLERQTSGDIYVGEKLVNQVHAKARDLAMVFQNYALYPHMTVLENLSFGLKNVHTAAPEIARRVQHAAEMLGLHELLKRRPRELSGGQRQRVALGRALVRSPRAFLLDEPLSNLDAKLRAQMRLELKELHDRLRTTMVYVTHDQVEAMTLGQRIVVMHGGRVQQVDTPDHLYDYPANTFVAAFIGSPPTNLLPGSLQDGMLQRGNALVQLPPEFAVRTAAHRGRDVLLGIRPEDFRPSGSAPADAGFLVARVKVVEYLGSEVLCHPDAGETRVAARFEPSVRPRPGESLGLSFAARRLALFDPQTGQRLD